MARMAAAAAWGLGEAFPPRAPRSREGEGGWGLAFEKEGTVAPGRDVRSTKASRNLYPPVPILPDDRD